ncbi:hypothetical protein M0R45_013066 [Rubus argutus]|uniref:Uncharacterized protein n=1 Tax=Rubus argutus TaxID=59490 RepID=A0AAW1XHY9_RUBAR
MLKVVGSDSRDWILSRIQGFDSRRLVRLTILGSANRLLPDLWGWHDGKPSLWWPNCFDVGCFVGLQARETSGVGDKVFFLGFVDHHWWLSLGKMTTGSSGCGTGFLLSSLQLDGFTSELSHRETNQSNGSGFMHDTTTNSIKGELTRGAIQVLWQILGGVQRLEE